MTVYRSASWKRHHRRLCAFSKTYASSSAYKDATEEVQADMCLLAHLAAEHFSKCNTLQEARATSNPTIQTFWDLLVSAQPDAGQNLISPLSFTSFEVLSAAASRFGNNNFVIHDARLVPYAHGVFALASRSFNHSCQPNAVAMFEETSNGPQMVIKIIEKVATGEEICILYTDPASPDSKRRDALQHAYGFLCQCPRCITGASAAPRSPADESILRSQIGTIVQEQLQNSHSSLETVRNALAPISLERELLNLLPEWTADFSKASHDGPYDQAIQHGNTVLGAYVLIYPGLHPLLELHCLELSKVSWNLYITNARPGSGDLLHVKHAAATYLRWAKQLAGINSTGVYRKINPCVHISICVAIQPNQSLPILGSTGLALNATKCFLITSPAIQLTFIIDITFGPRHFRVYFKGNAVAKNSQGDSIENGTNSKETSRQSKAPERSQKNHTHVKAFFDNCYPAFQYKQSKPAVNQFKELKKEYRAYWGKDEAKKTHEAFKGALTKDFNDICGTDEKDLASWQKLCAVLNLRDIPDDVELCKRLVKPMYVNPVDLVDTPYTGKPPKHFRSEGELSEYTKRTGKYFPRDNVYAGDLLKYPLRQIMVPGKGEYHPRQRHANKKGSSSGVRPSEGRLHPSRNLDVFNSSPDVAHV
ncbi:hypothetical protein OPQ81_006252 [Rhizoctonia solani]|nr:hypothetical protein OPQ81_006252 [Rhizoctonia solani]